MHVVVTAGHVDHGKSTLVRALTGMEPDRWAEERRRGMTIDLGFAWTALPSGVDMAFVDVPGHARFISSMLAGAAPVPAAVVVVAADEGWRQQSEEHLVALDAFGVRHGVLAVTRSDLADPAPALAAASARLGRSSLGPVEGVAVSGVTGAGMPELRQALDRLAAALPPADAAGPLRLWIDRAFTVRGAGTVVTGTLGAGTLAVGDRLRLAPDGREVRVRGLQALQEPAAVVPPVARVAVNLRGVDRAEVRRGQALIRPADWVVSASVDVRLSLPATDLPAHLVLHLGSAAVPVRSRPLGPDHARLALDHPLPLHVGDRGLLRDPSRHDRLAGVVVLDVAPPPLSRRGAAAARAATLATVGKSDPLSEVARRGAVRRSTLAAMGVPAGGDPISGVRAVGEWLVAAEQWNAWVAAVRTAAAAHAAARPLDPAPSGEALRHAVGVPDLVLLDAVARAADLVPDGGGWRSPDAGLGLPAEVAAALDALLSRLDREPFAAPEAPQLRAAGLTPAVLAAAARAGRLAAVGDGIWLRPQWPDVAVRRLAALPQPFTTSAARQALGTTRRVAVPLLEALDATRRTRRLDGSHRVVIGVPGSVSLPR